MPLFPRGPFGPAWPADGGLSDQADYEAHEALALAFLSRDEDLIVRRLCTMLQRHTSDRTGDPVLLSVETVVKAFESAAEKLSPRMKDSGFPPDAARISFYDDCDWGMRPTVTSQFYRPSNANSAPRGRDSEDDIDVYSNYTNSHVYTHQDLEIHLKLSDGGSMHFSYRNDYHPPEGYDINPAVWIEHHECRCDAYIRVYDEDDEALRDYCIMGGRDEGLLMDSRTHSTIGAYTRPYTEQDRDWPKWLEHDPNTLYAVPWRAEYPHCAVRDWASDTTACWHPDGLVETALPDGSGLKRLVYAMQARSQRATLPLYERLRPRLLAWMVRAMEKYYAPGGRGHKRSRDHYEALQ